MEKALLKKLERLRKEMNQLALEKGLSNHQVLLISQEIDGILNKLNDLKPYKSPERPNHNEVKERSMPYVYKQSSFVFVEWNSWKRDYLKIGALL